MNHQDHYTKIVAWSDEDQCYIGSAPGLIGPCCHGTDKHDVERQLDDIIIEWLAIRQTTGQEVE